MTAVVNPSSNALAVPRILTFICIVALAVLLVLWETVLAPVRPGAWILALKAIPLLLALPGLWRRHLRTYQWWSLIILLYGAEGLLRATSDIGLGRSLGWLEAGLSIVAFFAILLYCQRDKAARQSTSKA